MESDSFRIGKTIRKRPPIKEALFRSMKEKILGPNYELSVLFIGTKRSKHLNNTYRQKDKPTDILSFPLDKKTGEIYINLDCAKKKSVEHDRTFENYLNFLFIHGLLHLKGMDHGSKMESEERKYCAIFKI